MLASLRVAVSDTASHFSASLLLFQRVEGSRLRLSVVLDPSLPCTLQTDVAATLASSTTDFLFSSFVQS